MKKKKSTKLIIMLAVLGMILVCCCIAILAGGIYLANDNSGDGGDDTEDASYDQYQEFLGYEERDITIKNYYELDIQLLMYYYNWETLRDYEEEMYNAASSEDSETFFTYYSESNKVLSEMISQAKAIDSFMENPSNEGGMPVGNNLVSPVSAKDRWSFFYWVPVLEKLVKGKHGSIESARASIYNYIKNDPDLESVDRQALLGEYGLSDVEQIRNIDDAKVEQMARDPELRTAIDWGKVSSDVAKAGVEAYVDVIKSATSGDMPTPIVDTIKNGIVDISDGEIETVKDQIPATTSNTSQDTKVTFGLKKDVTQAVDGILGSDSNRAWDDISDDKKDEVLEKLLSEIDNGPLGVVYSPDTGEENKFTIPVGDWDLLGVTDGAVPVEMTDIEITEGKTTKITKPNLNIELVDDPDILGTLGGIVETNVSLPDVQNATSCEDYGVLDNSGAADTCFDSYEYCMEYPTETLEGYSACISAGGGCWDIGRSNTYESPASCPADLSTMNPDDFQYTGNLKYCQCVQACQEQYVVQKDCAGMLKTCCSNIL